MVELTPELRRHATEAVLAVWEARQRRQRRQQPSPTPPTAPDPLLTTEAGRKRYADRLARQFDEQGPDDL